MVALQSRRLESIFGAPLDALTSEHVRGLVTSNVQEAFDLDFKLRLYGRTDADKRELAGDVAALANTAGGCIVLGVDEDEHARAVSTPGVELSDAEVARMRQIVASRVAPMPDFDVLTVPDSVAAQGEAAVASSESSTAHGFLVIAVPRSPRAPHAVLINDALRYPKRNGSTTRYLSEPETATAYRDRFASAQRQVTRVEEVEREAIARLHTADCPWVIVSLMPDLAGDMTLSRDVFLTFQQQILVQAPTVVGNGRSFLRAQVGRRRLLADGTGDGSPMARWVSLELHTDGSGMYGMRLANMNEWLRAELPPNDGAPWLVSDEWIAIGVISGLAHLARHAQDRAAAGGTALIRAQLVPIAPDRPMEIGSNRQFPEIRSSHALTVTPPPAEAAAPLDGLTEPGPELVTAAALLVDELGQGFGIPEMGQLTRDGQLRRSYWDHNWQAQIVKWASDHGIGVT